MSPDPPPVRDARIVTYVHRHQVDVLDRLAYEQRISRSKAARRLLEQALADETREASR